MSDRDVFCVSCQEVTRWYDYGTESGEHECSQCGCHHTFEEPLDIAALDAEFEAKMKELGIDPESDRIEWDRYLVELLRRLGCDKTADAFENLPKWYA